MEKLFKIYSVFIVTLFFTLPTLANQQVKQLNLSAGEEKIVKVLDLKGISNAGDIVEDIVLNDGVSIIFRAVSWGDTQVMTWDKSGNQTLFKIHVEVPTYVKELETYLQGIEGVNVGFLGKNIIVDGQILRNGDMDKLKGILQTYPQVKNMVDEKLPNKSEVLIEAVKAETKNLTLKPANLGKEGLIVEGKFLNDRNKKSAEQLLGFYLEGVYPTLAINPVEISLNIDWVHLDEPENPNTSFNTFLKSMTNEKKADFYPFHFFDSISHQEALDSLKEGNKTESLKNWVIKSGNDKTFEWSESDERGHEFFLTIMPRVLDSFWVDCTVNVRLEKAGQSVFKKEERIVLRKGQGVALIGLEKLFSESLGQNWQTRLADFPSLKSNLAHKKGQGHFVLLLSSLWTIKNI